MGIFSIFGWKNMLYWSEVKKLVAVAIFLLLIFVSFVSFDAHHQGGESHTLAFINAPDQGPRKAQESRNHPFAAQLAPNGQMSHQYLLRNDTNDGSCEILRQDYPEISPSSANDENRKKFAVISYSDGLGVKQEHYCKVRANHCAYAEMDGDADCIDNRNLGMCVDAISIQAFHLLHPASLAKVSLMQHCCFHYEYVLFLDSDILLMNPVKYPLRRLISEAEETNKDVTFTGTEVEKAPFNSGLIGLRCNSQYALTETKDKAIGEEFLFKTMQHSRGVSRGMHGLSEQRTMTKLF